MGLDFFGKTAIMNHKLVRGQAVPAGLSIFSKGVKKWISDSFFPKKSGNFSGTC